MEVKKAGLGAHIPSVIMFPSSHHLTQTDELEFADVVLFYCSLLADALIHT